MKAEFSDRLKKLPPYLFVEIDKAKRRAVSEGRDIIDLGIGDPDLATPDFIIEAMNTAMRDKENHHYALDAGLPQLRQAIAKWYKKRFGVVLNPDKEIYPLIGSKEGIAHLPLGLINPGDKVLIPDPCYPPYRSGSIFAGAGVITMPLLEDNGFLPDLKAIKDAKLMFLNYPNNPTASCAGRGYYKDVVKIASKKGIIIASDLAYSELYYEEKPVSMLEIEGAKEMTIEFHSLSKTFNMTGWRIGWACGNESAIAALAKVKTNIDSGVFQAIQIAAVAALESDESSADGMRSTYKQRRDVLIDGLNNAGWPIEKPKATFYMWANLPKKYKSSIEMAKALLDVADIVATPGVGFGQCGEGYIRMAFTRPKDRLSEAVNRIKKVL